MLIKQPQNDGDNSGKVFKFIVEKGGTRLNTPQMEDVEAYLRWKQEAVGNGRAPDEIADKLEKDGHHEYAMALRDVIGKMEAAL